MKRVLFAIVLLSTLIVAPVSAGVDNFYFSDFIGDYYLSRDENNTSHLKVVESLTAVFPDYNQNKGICRQIPFTNQDGGNTTLPYLSRSNIKVTRNGEDEPIYSIDKYSNHYEVCTGTNDYVLGEQKYTFEYEFQQVVTDFGDYQELYWDTNGNGWYQRFDKLTARVHFAEDVVKDFADKSWCYVGKNGEKGQERCTIKTTEDGVEFSTRNIASNENLTFDIELKPGSFQVPPAQRNYMLVWIMVITVLICGLTLFSSFRKYIKSRSKRDYYKGYFVKPEYQPHKQYSIAEMAEIFIGTKKNVKVALLLDMVVRGKISFRKKEGQILKTDRWVIEVKEIDGLRTEELIVLTILNGGVEPEVGDTINVKVRSADSTLVKLAKKFDDTVLSKLKADDLVESKYRIGGTNVGSTVGSVVGWSIVLFFVLPMLMSVREDIIEYFGGAGALVGKDIFWPVMIVMIVTTMIMKSCLKKNTQKYLYHTLKGLEASRYMDGLKLYIKMAEADRLKLLQSVDGADTSPEGIVKLYEKLLPYAAVFGLEESWMNEMKKYCEVQELSEPDYLMNGIIISDLSRSLRNAASVAESSSHYSSSSISGGGGFSSGSSGGGGGGFSGGGGGGGGGGGR